MEERRIIGQMTVGKEDGGRPIIELLREVLALPKRQIKKAIATRGIRLNGRPVHSERRVKAGDYLEVSLPGQEQVKVEPVPMELAILYEDQWLLAVNKPVGINVHNTHPGQPPALANGVAHYFQAKGRAVTPRPVHRLDREASGVVLFAKDSAAQTRLTAAWTGETVRKTYWALVEGALATAGEVRTPIRGKAAHTVYRPLNQHDGYTELAINIYTGRTHQIRIHLAQVGHPLLGDRRYNPGSGFCTNRLALHGEELALVHPVTGEELRLVAPVPRDEITIAQAIK